MKLLNKNNLSKTTNAVILIIVLLVINANSLWKKQDKVITWDVLEYYSYLPATFIYNDVTLSFMNDENRNDYWIFWPHKSPTGKYVFKFTMGMSALYSPFFFVAHQYAKVSKYEANGYSSPYKLALLLSSWFFLALSLIFLRKILQRYFKARVIAFTLLLIVLGTNLLFYTGIRSAMSHVYNFALFSIFIYIVIKWYEKPKILFSILIGIIAGLIALIRPSNIIILLFLLFYKINSFKEFPERIRFLFSKYSHILLMILLFLLIWLPQLLYWKSQTAQFFYYTYRDEGFFFNNPQIIKGLFSYRNGWLLYTPLMLFSIIGIYFLFKIKNDFAIPILLFTLLNIYIVTSWWCWWYVGFGNRAFIDSYAILSIPLAAFITFIFKQKQIIKISSIAIIVFFLLLNIFQTWQFKRGYIQPDSMSKKAYWFLFFNTNPRNAFWGLLNKVDYEKAKQGTYVNLPKNNKTKK